MAISSFPPAESGATTNDFILNKNNTTNNQFEMGRAFAAGGYSVTVTGSTAYDIYLLNATGSAVGYTNGTTVVAAEAFESISALGLGTADTVGFTYNGPSTTADASGTEPGAGAYLVSITPSDLPQIDDTAIVAGGNFASDVQITFSSGTVELAAKNVVVGSSTALVVTRPDGLIEDLAPYTLTAVNPGVTPPNTSGLNVLAGTVTAGTDPSFVTTSPILGAYPGTAFSSAIVTSDTEGTVVAWAVTGGALPDGITLGTADGSLAGTPTTGGNYSFTVQITDDGGNTNSASFEMPVGFVVTGTNANSTVVGGTSYAWWETSGDLVYLQGSSDSYEYLVVAGGGGGAASNNWKGGGGGGAGGAFIGTVTGLTGEGTATLTLGAGGANHAQGSNTIIDAIATAIGGGYGGNGDYNGGEAGSSGGSGGGSGSGYFGGNVNGGTGTAGQGSNGGQGTGQSGGGGGGKGAAGTTPNGGAGGDFGAWATAIGIIVDGGYFAGGGGGRDGTNGTNGTGGTGGGGIAGSVGTANTGGGGGSLSTGGSGLVVVRWT